MVFIKEKLKEYNLNTDNLDYREFVIAAGNSHIIGFGRLRKTGQMYEIGCVTVVEGKRRKGIGSIIVKHLIEQAPVKMVYVITDMADYFRKLGFVEMKEIAKELMDALDTTCRVTGKSDNVIMVH
ncbi:MAG TPA: hypothetical protein DD713_03770 [Nitrospiraceae bacterium]|nr:hypothetical protein [Nitrospiraceae bacterium]